MAVLRKFVWQECPRYGMHGWIAKGMSGFDAGFGLSVAHDSLEHFSATDTSIEGEMLAFGAILYIRQDGAYWSRESRGANEFGPIMEGDLARFLCDVNGNLADPGRTVKLDDCLEHQLEEVRRRARKTLVSEQRDSGNYFPRDEALCRALGWIRKGYRKAARRYNNNRFPAYHVADMFADIEREVDKLSKHGREDGDELHVRFSLTRLTTDVRIIKLYGDDYYE